MHGGRPLIARVICPMVILLVVPGCTNPTPWGVRNDESPAPASTASSHRPATAGRTGDAGFAGDGLIVVQVHFDVMRVELPIRTIRHSAKIWNHVDELQIDPRRSALLARNGLRVGVADPDAWPAIHAVLQAHHAKSTRRQHAVQSGYPLTLDLGHVEDGETIFSYDSQGNLTGGTFGPGEKYIHVDYVVGADDPHRITLKVTPEIHVESPGKRWTNTGPVLPEHPRYRGRAYLHLAATVSLSPGEFLVIGPSEQARIAHLLGTRFLEREAGPARYETILLVTPQLFGTVDNRGGGWATAASRTEE